MDKQTEAKFPIDFFGVEELGRAIKRVRTLRGLTQHELAMQTNTSTKFISNVENGKDCGDPGQTVHCRSTEQVARCFGKRPLSCA